MKSQNNKKTTDYKSYHSFEKIKTATQLETYFDGRVAYMLPENKVNSRSVLHHYTTAKIVDIILGNKAFWLSCPSRFNDGKDRDSFGKDDELKRYYTLCLSAEQRESLPLWYLYSGIDGQGARISLSKKDFKRAILKSKYFLYEREENSLNQEVCELIPGVNMTIKTRDILYYRDIRNRDVAELKYNNKTLCSFSRDELKKYQSKYLGFFKKSIWNYEKEVRVLITLSNDLFNGLDKRKDYVVVMDFENAEIYNQLHIKLAPEIIDEDELFEWENIKNFTQITWNILQSDHIGEIEMKLCDKCEYKSDKIKCSDRVDKGADKK